MNLEDELLYDKTHGVFSFLNDPEIQTKLAPLLFEIVDKALEAASKVCPAIEPLRNLVQMFKPDLKHEEIMNKFEDLQFRLEDLKYDRLRAQREEAWQHAKTRITWPVREIENCARVVRILRDGVPETSLNAWLDELTKASQQINAALMRLFKAVSPVERETPLNENIFQCYYEFVGGDHRMVQNMVSTTLQILANGLTVCCVYEAQRHGSDFVCELFERYQFKQRFIEAANSGGQALTKCLTEYAENMSFDVKNIFYRNRSTSQKSKLIELAEMFYKKYYWLETFCVLYLPRNEKNKKNIEFDANDESKAIDIDVVDAIEDKDLETENELLLIDDLKYEQDVNLSNNKSSNKQSVLPDSKKIDKGKKNPNQHSSCKKNPDQHSSCKKNPDQRSSCKRRKTTNSSVDEEDISRNNSYDTIAVTKDTVDNNNLAELTRSTCIVFSREIKNAATDPTTTHKRAKKIREIIDDSISVFTKVKEAKVNIRESLRRENIDVWGLAVFKAKNVIGFECATLYRTSLNNIEKLVWVENHQLIVCVLLS